MLAGVGEVLASKGGERGAGSYLNRGLHPFPREILNSRRKQDGLS